MSEPHVASWLVRAMIANLVAYGIDRDEVLERAGVPERALGLTRIRLPWSYVEQLIEAAVELTGDDRFGLHFARPHDLTGFASLGLLLVASGDVGQAMGRLCRFSRLWSTAYTPRWRREPDRAVWSVEVHRPESVATLHFREEGMASTRYIFDSLLGGRQSVLEVSFEHERDGDLSEYEAVFGCEVRFGAPRTELVFPADILSRSVPTASPVFARHFEAEAERALDELEVAPTTGQRLERLLRSALAEGELPSMSLVTAAEALHQSPRSLQRALKAEGTSFAAELDRLRRQRAEELLATGAEIGEVAYRLGYALPSAFHRAFKRWTGMTPQAWRDARG